MSRASRVQVGLLPFVLSACLSSTTLVHVRPDGSGQITITTRVYPAGVAELDALQGDHRAPQTIEELLPAPSNESVSTYAGAPVRIQSSHFDKTVDGATRVTTADFDDVTKLRLRFPPVVLAGDWSMSSGGRDDMRITFKQRRHENGDRLLLVELPDAKMRDPAMPPDPPEKFEPKDEARLAGVRHAMTHALMEFSVEIESPLLRTNAPAREDRKATILRVELDRIVNSDRFERDGMSFDPATMQELLWQLGDMPGASLPEQPEVFLEFEAPPPPTQTLPPPPPAQAPPDTEIYLAPLRTSAGNLEVGPAVNVTNSKGYDNQPFFARDGQSLLFTSMRGGATQTDIYRYDVATRRISQVTSTPESEYSPTITPDGSLSVVRVEADGTQRLWQFGLDGSNPRLLLDAVKPVGYHAWAGDHTVALFVLGQPSTLQLADTHTAVVRRIASDIGRSIQPIPGERAISFVQLERLGEKTTLLIKRLDPASSEITLLTEAVEGAKEADCAWTSDGTLLMAAADRLWAWRPGQAGWTGVAGSDRLGLRGITRLAVSPRGDRMALVAVP